MPLIAGRDGLDPRQPTDLVPADYLTALAQDAAGLRVGVVSIDPAGFLDRLRCAGFDDPMVDSNGDRFRFRARTCR